MATSRALLRLWNDGNELAFDRLIPLVYGELHRTALRYLAGERSNVSLQATAAKAGVAPRYLELVRGIVQDRTGAFAPLAGLHDRWDAMPAVAARPDEATVRAAAAKLRDYVITYRKKLAWSFDVPRAPPLQVVSQPLVMYVNRQGAAHHRLLNPSVLISADNANPTAKGYDPALVIPAEIG